MREQLSFVRPIVLKKIFIPVYLEVRKQTHSYLHAQLTTTATRQQHEFEKSCRLVLHFICNNIKLRMQPNREQR